MNEAVRRINFRKRRSMDLVLGMRQDLQELGISGEIEKQILASVLNRINQYLEAEGADLLFISGIPNTALSGDITHPPSAC